MITLVETKSESMLSNLTSKQYSQMIMLNNVNLDFLAQDKFLLDAISMIIHLCKNACTMQLLLLLLWDNSWLTYYSCEYSANITSHARFLLDD
jgi:hypothetical protein